MTVGEGVWNSYDARAAVLRPDCTESKCTLCGAPAVHKVGEELQPAVDLLDNIHNMTATVCTPCFKRIFCPYLLQAPPTEDFQAELRRLHEGAGESGQWQHQVAGLLRSASLEPHGPDVDCLIDALYMLARAVSDQQQGTRK